MSSTSRIAEQVGHLSRSLFQMVRNNVYLLILFATSIQRLAWFQGDNLIIGGDLVPLLNPVAHLTNLVYIWNDANLGALKVTVPRLFSPFYFSEAIGQLSGWGNSTMEKILVVSMYFLAATSIYYVWPLIFKQMRWKSSAFAASIAYVYSPYLIADGIQTSVRFAVEYALVPFFLLLFVRGVVRNDIRYALVISLLSPFIFSDFPGYQTAGYVAILCLCFSVFHVVSSAKKRFNVYFMGLSSALSILVNMWWMLPIVTHLSSYTSALTLAPGVLASQGYSTVTQLFRFLGKWSFYSSFNGVNYLPYSATYNGNPVSVALSFGPIAIAFGAVLLRPRSRAVLFCSWLALISFFLTKGTNPPLGYAYQSLLSIFPPFRVYGESFYLLQMAVIPTSLMIGATIGGFFESFKQNYGLNETKRGVLEINHLRKYVVPMVLIAIILGAGWPLLSNAISVNGLGGSSHGVEIPDSYSKLISSIEQDPASLSSKVLVLPQRGDYSAYSWGYIGGNLLYDALPNIVLGGDTVYLPSLDTQWAANLLYESFYNNSTSFPILLNMIGVKYIVLENTFNTTFYNLPPISTDRAILLHQSSIVLDKDFGEVSLYRNLNFTSEVYVPKGLIPFDYSIAQPGGTVWQDSNLTSGWRVEKWNNETTSSESYNGSLHVRLQASGGYSAGSIIKQIPVQINGARHVLVTYRTNAFTSFTIEVVAEHGTYYPNSTNSPMDGPGKSVGWYTQAFDLSVTEGNPKGIRIWITNYDDKGYSGNLDLWISSISLVRFIGSTSDLIGLLENPAVNGSTAFYASRDLPETVTVPNPSSLSGATILSFIRENPTSYSVVLQLAGPTLLIFSEAYSVSWTARIGGAIVQDHFRMNRFANAWLISGNGRTTVDLEFSEQSFVWYGIGISIVSAVSAFATVALIQLRKKTGRRTRC
jgi:hypothetical protein